MRPWRAHFESGELWFSGYPFPRRGSRERIAAAAIGEVCVGWAPPTLRLRTGEYLFVPATQVRELADFADRNAISFVRRADLWSLVLEEFLDTEFSPEMQEGTVRILEENGVSRAETQALRALVGRRMLTLTALSWEWVHYGLFDVLEAMKPFTFLSGRSFASFYGEAMEFADRGSTEPATREDLLRLFP